jgi:MscS family membrane protein
MDQWWQTVVAASGTAGLTGSWLPKVAMVVLATMTLQYLSKRFLARVARLATRSSSEWDDILVNSAKRPLPVLVWVLGIALAADIIRLHGKEAADPLFAYVPILREVGVVICMAWFLWRLVNESGRYVVVKREMRGEEVDSTTVDALSKLCRLAIVITATLVVMQTFGFSVSGILAAGGIGGIAVGFAAKDLLANFFGGLTIYLDRPFSVGDWIRSPDKAIEGTVEAISWRHTRIRAFNKNPIYVPNSVFTTIVVENPSRMTHRRIKETVGIRYSDLPAMAAIVAEVKAMLMAHPEIDTTQTMIVNFNAFAASSLDFFIYTFTKTRDWVTYHGVKQDVLLRIAAIIDAHGAEIAFPTRTLHVQAESAPPMP